MRREFAKRLKAARVIAGYPHANGFAKQLGMDEPETYRRWERGETEPNLAFLKKIALLTNQSLDKLLDINDSERPTKARRPFTAVG